MKYLIAFILICIMFCDSKAQENKIDSFMNDLVFRHKLAGAAVAALRGEKIIFNKNYGFSDLKNETPVTDGTSFNIMSITKIFIAFTIVQLADQKIIDLDAPIKKYLHDLPSQYDSVLIFQLLNHSSGVTDYVHVNGYMAQANQTQTPMQVIGPVLNKPFEFTPGKKNEYSNSGYFLLGLLIENVTREKLGQYLKENIFRPAGMNDTYLEMDLSQRNLKAKGYININGELKEEIMLNPSQYWAAGGVVSTKNDLIKWDNALLANAVLPRKEIVQMMQPSKLSSGALSEYGLGFELMNTPTIKVAGNNGAGLGYNASNLDFLNDGLTVIVLTNTSNSNSSFVAKNIRDIIVNETDDAKNENQTKQDKLDTLVMQVLNDATNSVVNPANFNDSAAVLKFRSGTVVYVQSQGKLLTIQMQGQKINPQNIVRRYEVTFEKETTMWVFIFSGQGKILLANHM